MPRSKILAARAVRPYQPLAREGWEELPNVQEQIHLAMQQGYQEGIEKARKDAAEEVRELREQYVKGLAELVRLQDEVVEGVRRELVGLALHIAARIVRVRIEEGDPVAERVITELAGKTGEREASRIRLNPEDLEALKQGGNLSDESSLEFIADRKITRGGAIVECGGEEIDGRLETALAALAEAVLETT